MIFGIFLFQAKIKDSYGILEKTSEVSNEYCDWFVKRDDELNCREKWMDLEHRANQRGATLNTCIPLWPVNILGNVGKFLYNIIFHDLKLGSVMKNKSGNPGAAFFKIVRTVDVKSRVEVNIDE